MQVVFYIAFAIMSRLIPHPANMTSALSSVLLIARRTSRAKTLLSVLVVWLGTDAILAYCYGYSFVSRQTLIYYLSYVVMTLLAWTYVNKNSQQLFSSPYSKLIVMCFSFWMVSNFIVWCISGMYPRTTAGLLDCYLMALPFLRNMVLGETIYFTSLTWLEKIFSQRSIWQASTLKKITP